MGTFTQKLVCGSIAFFAAAFVSLAQTSSSPAPGTGGSTSSVDDLKKPATNPAPPAIPPGGTKTAGNVTKPDAANPITAMTVVQASGATPGVSKTAPITGTANTTNSTTTTTTTPAGPADSAIENGGVGVREFQGDDVGQVLRLLARQAKINMVVSDQLPKDSAVTMRLEDVTALQAIAIIVKAKGLFMDKIDNVYYVKTEAERAKEPTESDSYQFSYSRAKDVAPLLASQLASKDPPQVDDRTNTIFFRETRSNMDNIRKLLVTIDKPTKQVMIEARLVEVTANPKQSYGINWGGVVGSSTNPQTITYGGWNRTQAQPGQNIPTNGLALGNQGNGNFLGSFGSLATTIPQSTFAILSVPQFSATLRFLNEDADAEFLANPRIVTADNQQAKIEISRNQPVPQLNFNEQTATAVFGGFQDKKFGNTLIVRPSVNKDNFVTLSVKPEISNKVGDAQFTFAGATVTSPIIDTRSLDSNVLIRSGNTLAIGGLLQDEQTKARNKVPILGAVPLVGY